MKYVNNAATMLSGLCGLATLFIAILLYDRYGIKSKTKEQTLKSLEYIIVELQKIHFQLCYYSETKDGNTITDYIIPISFQSNKKFVIDSLPQEALSSILYYKSSGILGCSQLVERIQYKVFLPKKIIDAVQRLNVIHYQPQTISKETRPIASLSSFSDKINNLNDTLDGTNTYIPEQKFTVIQFIDAYFGVKNAIIEWYHVNNIDTSEFNL